MKYNEERMGRQTKQAMNPFEDVRKFHEKFGVPALEVPGVPDESRVELRMRLIQEEFEELIEAMGYWIPDDGPPERDTKGLFSDTPPPLDLPKTADAIADLIYVLIGTAHEFGIPIEAVWNAVQATNMAKVGGGEDAKGKIQKPPGWVAPDVEGILTAHGWQGAGK